MCKSHTIRSLRLIPAYECFQISPSLPASKLGVFYGGFVNRLQVIPPAKDLPVPRSRITGIRSWTCAAKLFGPVVRIRRQNVWRTVSPLRHSPFAVSAHKEKRGKFFFTIPCIACDEHSALAPPVDRQMKRSCFVRRMDIWMFDMDRHRQVEMQILANWYWLSERSFRRRKLSHERTW